MTAPPWTASEPSDKVIPAFVKAVMTLDDIVRDAAVAAGPIRYRYATLTNVMDEVRPKLAAEGLVLVQTPTTEGVGTTIFHESGQWIAFAPLHIDAAGGTPQAVGSAISYARRYTILANMGLSTEDDDGRSASVHTAPAHVDPAIMDRVNEVQRLLKALEPTHQTQLKEWAEGRSLSPKAMWENKDWLSEVEAALDELFVGAEEDADAALNDDDDEDEKDTSPEEPF